MSGWRARVKRALRALSPRFQRIHLLILDGRLDTFADAHLESAGPSDRRGKILQSLAAKMEFVDVRTSDTAVLDELTRIDPWGTSKEVSLRKLTEGWRCNAVIVDGYIVATGWAAYACTFTDSFLKRDLTLGVDELYFWRGFTVVSYRGKGIVPILCMHMSGEAVKHGCSRGLMVVRPGNRQIIRSMTKIGWKPAGSIGFVEAYGLRFHYLWGRNAFKATRKRMFVRWNG